MQQLCLHNDITMPVPTLDGGFKSQYLCKHLEVMHLAPELMLEKHNQIKVIASSSYGDIYALGCVVHQIVSRQKMIDEAQFSGEGTEQMNTLIVDLLTDYSKRPSISWRGNGSSFALRNVFEPCCNMQPLSRPTTASIKPVMMATLKKL